MNKEIALNIVSLVVVFVIILVLFQYFDLSDIQSFVNRFGIWAPVAFVAAKASTIVFAPLSGSALYPVAGAAFGFWKGFFVMLAGDMLGGIAAFYISKRYGVKIVEKFIKEDSVLMKKTLHHLGTLKGFIFARICFIPMPEIVCYAAGLTKMSYVEFIAVHLVVDIFTTAILVGAGTFFTVNFSPLLLLALLVLGTLGTVGGTMIFYKKVK